MIRFLLLLTLCLLSTGALAHPGVGIVVDVLGNVFYTDLEHIWKQDPDGRKSIAVRDVHTHELYLDATGRLYGEHVWYEGDATGKWGHYVWCLHPDGRLEKVIPNTEGFRRDYSFVRDPRGTMYWMEDVKGHQEIRCRATTGKTRTLATGHFGPSHWLAYALTPAPNSAVHFFSGDTLLRLSSAGRLTHVAHGISRRHPVQNHQLMGLWTDAAGRVYVANAADRRVQRITPGGNVSTVATGSAQWTASGGTTTPNGDLWLLEFSPTNAVRVRRIVGGAK